MSDDPRFPHTKIKKEDIDKSLLSFEKYEPEWVQLSSVIPKIQPWFWPGMIPNNTLTLFAGIGGIGKSLLLLYLAAKTTTAEIFKAGGFDHQLPKGSVILLSAEDDIEYHISPKLMAMNADCEKIHYLKSKVGSVSKKKKFIELDKDIYILEQKINELTDVKLIIIDPISYFTGDTKDHVSTEVANFLNQLIDLAKKYNIAIVLNKHLRKQASGSKGAISAANEVGGSGAWTNTPRKCWLITDHHEDENVKIITQMKDNLSKKNTNSLAFKISPKSIINGELSIETTEVTWLDQTISMSSTDAVSKESYEKSKIETAIDLILDYLKVNGQSLVSNIQDCLLKKGVKRTTFLRSCMQFEQVYADVLLISRGIKNSKLYMLKQNFE